MITPDISIDVDGAIRHLTRVEREQVPFAVSKALNTLARRAQAEVRQTLEPRFTIAPSRRKFLELMVKIPRGAWATKKNLAVRLGVGQGEQAHNQIGSKKDRGHLLGRHEEGGDRAADSSLRPFFIPTEELRPGARDLPPRKLYPIALGLMESRYISPRAKKTGSQHHAPARGRVTGRGKVMLQGKHGTFVMGSAENRTQSWGIWRRTGKGKGGIEPLWWFRMRVRLPKRLKFGLTVQRVVDRDWSVVFDQELGAALRSAR